MADLVSLQKEIQRNRTIINKILNNAKIPSEFPQNNGDTENVQISGWNTVKNRTEQMPLPSNNTTYIDAAVNETFRFSYYRAPDDFAVAHESGVTGVYDAASKTYTFSTTAANNKTTVKLFDNFIIDEDVIGGSNSYLDFNGVMILRATSTSVNIVIKRMVAFKRAGAQDFGAYVLFDEIPVSLIRNVKEVIPLNTFSRVLPQPDTPLYDDGDEIKIVFEVSTYSTSNDATAAAAEDIEMSLNIPQAELFQFEKFTKGEPGDDGDDGWTPVLALEIDGERVVLKVINYVGGTGTPRRFVTGFNYVGPDGLVSKVDAINVRGAAGAPGTGGGGSTLTQGEFDDLKHRIDAINELLAGHHTTTLSPKFVETAIANTIKATYTGIGGTSATPVHVSFKLRAIQEQYSTYTDKMRFRMYDASNDSVIASPSPITIPHAAEETTWSAALNLEVDSVYITVQPLSADGTINQTSLLEFPAALSVADGQGDNGKMTVGISIKGLIDDVAANTTKLQTIEENAEENVQSDWNETNNNKDSYIKNKPTIPAGSTVDNELSETSQNAVQNKIIKAEFDEVREEIAEGDNPYTDITPTADFPLTRLKAPSQAGSFFTITADIPQDWINITDGGTVGIEGTLRVAHPINFQGSTQDVRSVAYKLEYIDGNDQEHLITDYADRVALSGDMDFPFSFGGISGENEIHSVKITLHYTDNSQGGAQDNIGSRYSHGFHYLGIAREGNPAGLLELSTAQAYTKGDTVQFQRVAYTAIQDVPVDTDLISDLPDPTYWEKTGDIVIENKEHISGLPAGYVDDTKSLNDVSITPPTNAQALLWDSNRGEYVPTSIVISGQENSISEDMIIDGAVGSEKLKSSLSSNLIKRDSIRVESRIQGTDSILEIWGEDVATGTDTKIDEVILVLPTNTSTNANSNISSTALWTTPNRNPDNSVQGVVSGEVGAGDNSDEYAFLLFIFGNQDGYSSTTIDRDTLIEMASLGEHIQFFKDERGIANKVYDQAQYIDGHGNLRVTDNGNEKYSTPRDSIQLRALVEHNASTGSFAFVVSNHGQSTGSTHRGLFKIIGTNAGTGTITDTQLQDIAHSATRQMQLNDLATNDLLAVKNGGGFKKGIVNTADINDGAVSSAKINNGAVSSTKLSISVKRSIDEKQTEQNVRDIVPETLVGSGEAGDGLKRSSYTFTSQEFQTLRSANIISLRHTNRQFNGAEGDISIHSIPSSQNHGQLWVFDDSLNGKEVIFEFNLSGQIQADTGIAEHFILARVPIANTDNLHNSEDIFTLGGGDGIFNINGEHTFTIDTDYRYYIKTAAQNGQYFIYENTYFIFKYRKTEDNKTQEVRDWVAEIGTAHADQTPEEIRDSLISLNGEDRLSATAIKNLPTGGGSSTTQLVGSGDFDVTVIYTFATEANSSAINLSEGKWFLINFGKQISTNVEDGRWYRINGDKFRALPISNYGDISLDAKRMFVGYSADNASVYIGRTSDNNLLFTSSSIHSDALPITVERLNSTTIYDGITTKSIPVKERLREFDSINISYSGSGTNSRNYLKTTEITGWGDLERLYFTGGARSRTAKENTGIFSALVSDILALESARAGTLRNENNSLVLGRDNRAGASQHDIGIGVDKSNINNPILLWWAGQNDVACYRFTVYVSEIEIPIGTTLPVTATDVNVGTEVFFASQGQTEQEYSGSGSITPVPLTNQDGSGSFSDSNYKYSLNRLNHPNYGTVSSLVDTQTFNKQDIKLNNTEYFTYELGDLISREAAWASFPRSFVLVCQKAGNYFLIDTPFKTENNDVDFYLIISNVQGEFSTGSKDIKLGNDSISESGRTSAVPYKVHLSLVVGQKLKIVNNGIALPFVEVGTELTIKYLGQ